MRLATIAASAALCLATPALASPSYTLACDVAGAFGERTHVIRVDPAAISFLSDPDYRLIERGSHDLELRSLDRDRVVLVLSEEADYWPRGAVSAVYTLDRNAGTLRVDYRGTEGRFTPTFGFEKGPCTRRPVNF